MAIEIPHEVALFLNFIGVPYPDINEDQVRELAEHVRTFAEDVSGTHEAATGTITEMGSVYQGQSYRALVASWARLSSSHMERLDELCRGVAAALEIAAEVITVVKAAVLTELALLASAYTAAMAATLATSGASAAVGQSIAMVAKRLVKAMEEMLVAYILAEVLGKAIEPLEQAVSDMISGVVYDVAADALGVDDGGGDGLLIDPDEVRRYAQVLDDHADDIMKHADKFANKVSALDFTTPIAPDPASAPESGPGNTPREGGDPNAVRRSPVDTERTDPPAAPRNWLPTAGNDTGSRDTHTPGGPPRVAAADGAVPGESGGKPPTAASAPTGAAASAPDGAAAPAQGPSAPGGGPTGGASPAAAEGGIPAPAERGSSAPDSAIRSSEQVAAGAHSAGAATGSEPVEKSMGRPVSGPVDSPERPASVATAGDTSGDPRAPAASAAGAQDGTQSSPWNRSSPQGAPAAGSAGGKAPAGTAAARGVERRRGGAGKPHPWAADPATAPVPARTPWARPGRSAPAPIPAVAAAGDTAPPVPAAPEKKPVRSSEELEGAVRTGDPVERPVPTGEPGRDVALNGAPPDTVRDGEPGRKGEPPRNSVPEPPERAAPETGRSGRPSARFVSVAPPPLRDEGPPRG
ncbi:WXG100 family type VII secretion target [Nocardia sp. X0981]